jgi:hypothetical protein
LDVLQGGIYGDKFILYDNANGDLVHNWWNADTYALLAGAVVLTCILGYALFAVFAAAQASAVASLLTGVVAVTPAQASAAAAVAAVIAPITTAELAVVGAAVVTASVAIGVGAKIAYERLFKD